MERAERLFVEGDELYRDMLAAIAAARRRVWVESYIFAGDRVGRRFAAALARAARRGLDVRLHVDAAGSFLLPLTTCHGAMRRAGVAVREFHRWSWRDPWRYNRRNHCKLLLLGDACVYVGGFNVHEESSRAHRGERRWRDTHIRVDDPGLVRQAAELFEVFWTHRVPRRLRRGPAPDPLAGGTLVTNRLPRHRHALRWLYRQGLSEARGRVLVTTPYFAPDPLTRAHLLRAAARGAEVHLLLPGVSDQPFVQMAARHIYHRLLAAGLRIYEYLPRPLHAKTIVVDGRWASVGSANLDYRSFFHNYELNYVTTEPETCRAMETQFWSDRAVARQITLDDVGRLRWWERLAGLIAWRLRWWL